MPMKRAKYPVTGMSCAACAARVQKALSKVEGVASASVNYATGEAEVECSDSLAESMLIAAVEDAGYGLIVSADAEAEAEQEQARNYQRLKVQTIVSCALAVPLLIIGMALMHAPWANWTMLVLSTGILVAGGGRFYAGAIRQARHGSANMDTLVALSTGIAYIFSLFNMFAPGWWLSRGITPHVYFEAAGVIIAFILLGRLLEARARRSTSGAVRELAGMQPRRVRIINADGSETLADISEVKPGDVLRANAGERIAADGHVERGHSFVDESMLTGEPVAAEKMPGDRVFAGTVNSTGSFDYTVEKVAGDTLLARIISMVEQAQGSKPRVQRLADRIAAVFVPCIMVIAVLTFIAWTVFEPTYGVVHGLLTAVTVLIIACPCALGLATPTAIIVGVGRGAKLGLLIKDADSIEAGQKVDTVVLDKTGTLTTGKPTVESILWPQGQKLEWRSAIRSLEERSGHPLGAAIVEYLATEACEIEQLQVLPGLGVECRWDGATLRAGSRRLMEKNHISIPEAAAEFASSKEAQGMTLVWFSLGDKLIAVAALTDAEKPESREAIAQLQSAGVEVWILSGDSEAAVAKTARSLGIRHYKGGLLPADKAEFISGLERQGRHVAMVGDGINDSAAMAAATLSIAMGTGTDIAMEVAGITIVNGNIAKVPTALALSRLTMRTVRQNLFWAFIYNIIGVPIAAGVLYPLWGFLLNPMIAGAAMAFSSVSVVSNALLLRRRKLPEIKIQNPIKPVSKMKKTYKVSGMSCHHCSGHVERALNSIDGVSAKVNLEEAKAEVEFAPGAEKSLEELQAVVSDRAGDYTLSE